MSAYLTEAYPGSCLLQRMDRRFQECMYVYMYVCTYMYVCMYVYVCMHMYVCVYICMYIILLIQDIIFISAGICMCVCVDAFALLYIHNYVCSDQLMALVDCIYAHYDIGPG